MTTKQAIEDMIEADPRFFHTMVHGKACIAFHGSDGVAAIAEFVTAAVAAERAANLAILRGMIADWLGKPGACTLERAIKAAIEKIEDRGREHEHG